MAFTHQPRDLIGQSGIIDKHGLKFEDAGLVLEAAVSLILGHRVEPRGGGNLRRREAFERSIRVGVSQHGWIGRRRGPQTKSAPNRDTGRATSTFELHRHVLASICHVQLLPLAALFSPVGEKRAAK
jgi:hypothetical protein